MASSISKNKVTINDVREVIRQLKERSSTQPLSGAEILDLFSNLFGQDNWRERGLVQPVQYAPSSHNSSSKTEQKSGLSESSGRSSSDADEIIIELDGTKYSKLRDRTNNLSGYQMNNNNNNGSGGGNNSNNNYRNNNYNDPKSNLMEQVDDQMMIASTKYNQSDSQIHINQRNNVEMYSSNQHDKMENALELLQKVNIILEQLSIFWSNTEIVLDLLSKKGQHAEQFVGFSRSPKLLSRFHERMAEYR